MLRKLIVAAAISAAALGATVPSAASAHEYGYGGDGYYNGYHRDRDRDWRSHRDWEYRRWHHRRWNDDDRYWRWRHHHRYWNDRDWYRD